MKSFKVSDKISCEYVYQKYGSPNNPDEHHLLVIYGNDVGIGYYNGLCLSLHSSFINEWHKLFFEHSVTFKILFEKCRDEKEGD